VGEIFTRWRLIPLVAFDALAFWYTGENDRTEKSPKVANFLFLFSILACLGFYLYIDMPICPVRAKSEVNKQLKEILDTGLL